MTLEEIIENHHSPRAAYFSYGKHGEKGYRLARTQRGQYTWMMTSSTSWRTGEYKAVAITKHQFRLIQRHAYLNRYAQDRTIFPIKKDHGLILYVPKKGGKQ